jgi:hypothetical protein
MKDAPFYLLIILIVAVVVVINFIFWKFTPLSLRLDLNKLEKRIYTLEEK